MLDWPSPRRAVILVIAWLSALTSSRVDICYIPALLVACVAGARKGKEWQNFGCARLLLLVKEAWHSWKAGFNISNKSDCAEFNLQFDL